MSELSLYAALIEAAINSVICPRGLLKSLQEGALRGALGRDRDPLPAEALAELKVKTHRLSGGLTGAGVIAKLKAALSSEQLRPFPFTPASPAREREREKEAERERGGVKLENAMSQRSIRRHW